MNPQTKEPTPPRVKLPKGFKLPKSMKTPMFMKMPKRDQRAFMLAYHIGEERRKSASKRDVETYAENPQNNKIGRQVHVG